MEENRPRPDFILTAPPAKTRGERRWELLNLLGTPNGLRALQELYQVHFRLCPRHRDPLPHVMIARLLSVEYPDG
jgi:hypothetical protein